MTARCPTCKRPLDDERPEPRGVIEALPLTAFQQRIIRPLLADFGRYIPRQRHMNAVFRLSRGDLTVAKKRSRITGAVRGLNRKLVTAGLTVETKCYPGHGSASRLTWIIEQLVCENCGARYPADERARLCSCGGRLVSLPVREELRQRAA